MQCDANLTMCRPIRHFISIVDGELVVILHGAILKAFVAIAPMLLILCAIILGLIMSLLLVIGIAVRVITCAGASVQFSRAPSNCFRFHDVQTIVN